jgi:hypothetical protein
MPGRLIALLGPDSGAKGSREKTMVASSGPTVAPAVTDKRIRGAAPHRRVLKHMNHDSPDQHGLPVRWGVRR